MNQVPYTLLARAEQDAREQFPNAFRVKALWTPGSACEVNVEIWHSARSATVHSWTTNGN